MTCAGNGPRWKLVSQIVAKPCSSSSCSQGIGQLLWIASKSLWNQTCAMKAMALWKSTSSVSSGTTCQLACNRARWSECGTKASMRKGASCKKLRTKRGRDAILLSKMRRCTLLHKKGLTCNFEDWAGLVNRQIKNPIILFYRKVVWSSHKYLETAC